METVFVYADKQVGLRDIPPSFANSPDYREPVRVPFRATFQHEDFDPSCITYQIRRFLRAGRMFDSRPIFCDDSVWKGVDVLELSAWYVEQDDNKEQVQQSLRSIASKMVQEKHGLVLDEKTLDSADPDTHSKYMKLFQKVAIPLD